MPDMRKWIVLICVLAVCALLFFLFYPHKTGKNSGVKEPVAPPKESSSGSGSPVAQNGKQPIITGPRIPAEPGTAGAPGILKSPPRATTPSPEAGGQQIAGPIPASSPGEGPSSPLVIDVDVLRKGGEKKLSALMAERKKMWGLEKSVDVVATGDEKVKFGDFVISLDEIQKYLKIAAGNVVTEDLKEAPSVRKTLSYFGIRLVRPGDNLWDVHFGILKEYLASRGIRVSAEADRPDKEGRSSGVARVLKFAENMVVVYNLETKSPPKNLNVLHAGAEVVIFNFTPIFKLLSSVEFKQLSHIRFDGKMLYLEPAK